jgi:hypothetical protein
MTDETPAAPEAAPPPIVNRGGRPRGRPKVRGREVTHEPSREPEGRAERIPLGSHRQKLVSDTRPGFVRRWINDKGARLQYAMQGAWSFVRKDGSTAKSSDPGEGVSQVVGTKEGGEPMRAYLMEIRKDWFDKDQAAKQERIDEREAQINRGKDEHGEVGKDGRYMRVGAKRIGL